MWSWRWHFANKSVAGAPYSAKSYSLSHSWTLWWRVYDDWNMQCRLEVAAELQQRWRRTNRRRKSIPRSRAVTGKARSPSVVRHVDGMTWVGPRNQVLGGGPDYHPRERGNLRSAPCNAAFRQISFTTSTCLFLSCFIFLPDVLKIFFAFLLQKTLV